MWRGRAITWLRRRRACRMRSGRAEAVRRGVLIARGYHVVEVSLERDRIHDRLEVPERIFRVG